MSSPTPVIARTLANNTGLAISAGSAHWRADLSTDLGGAGLDPAPHDLLDSALAACTLLTMKLYAKRKNYPLEAAEVRVEREETADVYRMRRHIDVHGALSEEQRADLLRVANACPIHKALSKRFEIETVLAAAPA